MRLLTALLLFSTLSYAALPPEVESMALSMVPRGRIIEKTFREYTVKSKAGTKIKLEFEREGVFQEAQGLNLNHGDDFEPGQGLISLASIAQTVSKLGHQVKGPWNLEKDKKLGWVYELSGESAGESVSLLIDASNGKILKLIPNSTE